MWRVRVKCGREKSTGEGEKSLTRGTCTGNHSLKKRVLPAGMPDSHVYRLSLGLDHRGSYSRTWTTWRCSRKTPMSISCRGLDKQSLAKHGGWAHIPGFGAVFVLLALKGRVSEAASHYPCGRSTFYPIVCISKKYRVMVTCEVVRSIKSPEATNKKS